MNEVEATFVKTFITRDKQERWLSLLSSEKKRRKLLSRLPHVFDRDLDLRFAHDEDNVPNDVAIHVEEVLRSWKKVNPDQLCYLITAYSEKDGQMVKLSEVETDYSLTYGVIVVIIPNKLAYYRTERSNINKQPFYVLFHPASNEHQSISS